MAKNSKDSGKKEDMTQLLAKELGKQYGLDLKGGTLRDLAYSFITNKVAEAGGPTARAVGFSLGQRFFPDQPERVELVAGYVENGWRIAVPMADSIYSITKKMSQNLGHYTNIRNDYRRSCITLGEKTGFLGIGGHKVNLEMIDNDRAAISGKTTNDLKSEGVKILLNLPNTLRGMADKHLSRLTSVDKTEKLLKKTESELEKAIAAGKPDKTISTLNSQIIKIKADQETVKASEDFMLKISGNLNLAEGEESQISGTTKFVANFLSGSKCTTQFEDIQTRDDMIKYLTGIRDVGLGEFATAGMSALKPILTQKLKIKSATEINKPTAGKMVRELQELLREDPNPSHVDLAGATQKHGSLADYLVDIFVQHEEDCGRGEIPQRVLTDIKHAADNIAEMMLNPHVQLHPQAMVLLADSQHGIITHRSNTADSCLYGHGLEAHLVKLVQEPAMSRLPKQTAQQLINRFQASEVAIQQSWDELSFNEQEMFAMLLPKEVVVELGGNADFFDRIMSHTGAGEAFDAIAESYFKAVKDLSEKDLKAAGLNEDQIRQINEAQRENKKKDSHYAQRHRADMSKLIADTSILLDRHDAEKFAEEAEKKKEKEEKKAEEKEAKKESNKEDKDEDSKAASHQSDDKDDAPGEGKPAEKSDEKLVKKEAEKKAEAPTKPERPTFLKKLLAESNKALNPKEIIEERKEKKAESKTESIEKEREKTDTDKEPDKQAARG